MKNNLIITKEDAIIINQVFKEAMKDTSNGVFLDENKVKYCSEYLELMKNIINKIDTI